MPSGLPFRDPSCAVALRLRARGARGMQGCTPPRRAHARKRAHPRRGKNACNCKAAAGATHMERCGEFAMGCFRIYAEFKATLSNGSRPDCSRPAGGPGGKYPVIFPPAAFRRFRRAKATSERLQRSSVREQERHDEGSPPNFITSASRSGVFRVCGRDPRAFRSPLGIFRGPQLSW